MQQLKCYAMKMPEEDDSVSYNKKFVVSSCIYTRKVKHFLGLGFTNRNSGRSFAISSQQGKYVVLSIMTCLQNQDEPK